MPRRVTYKYNKDTHEVDKIQLDGWSSRWMDTEAFDMLGREIKDGDWLARAVTSGRASSIEIRCVREIKNGRIYVDTSKVPMNFPGRTLIVNQEITEDLL